MKPINNKKRQWFLGVALVSVSVLVWLGYVWSPLADQRGELEADLSLLSQERNRLAERLKRLSDAEQDPKKTSEILARLSGLVIRGNSPEEVSSHTQQWLQAFLENHGLSLRAYKGLSPSKWRDYHLSQVQFQVDATTQGLADLLETLENMKTAVRVQKFGVNYRRNRENSLSVSLHIGTLFVEGL